METVGPSAANIYQNNVVHGGRVHYGPHITYNVTHSNQFSTPQEMLIASLKYKEINIRRNTISSNHPQTFAWAFDPNKLRPWDDLSSWLRQKHGIFWIQGKAGSGKSTLMRFLTQDTRTKSLLREWAAPQEPILIQFYFWLSGTKLQRSFRGFLCSMLRQLLQAHTSLADILLPEIDTTDTKEDTNDWSVAELKGAILAVTTASDRPICMFVDGLDEYDAEDDVRDLLDLLGELSACEAVKLCLSSRPEVRFEQEFHSCPKLRLQDLTKEDMHVFVHERLRKVYSKMDIQYVKNTYAAELEDMVIRKADGVFLWVHYALASIQKGLTHDDNETTLAKRLKDLPSGMSALYSSMWARLNGDSRLYREEANTIFACADTNQSLFDLMVTLDETLANEYMTKVVPLPLADLSTRIRTMKKRLDTRCAGLLEVKDPKDRHEYARADWYCYACDGVEDTSNSQLIKPHPKSSFRVGQQPLLNLLRGTVTYIHRSARDFLSDTAEGRLIKGEPNVSRGMMYSLALKARLASLIEDLDTPETVLYWQLPGLMIDLQRSSPSEKHEQEMLSLVERVGKAVVSRKHYTTSIYGWYHCIRSDSHLGYPYLSLTEFAAAMGNVEFLNKHFRDILEHVPRGADHKSRRQYSIKPYYLGHLFTCAALRIDTEIWRDQIMDIPLSARLKNFKVMQWLMDRGADLTSEYCYTIGESRGRSIVSPFEIFSTAVYRILDTIPVGLDKEAIKSIVAICKQDLPDIVLPFMFAGPSWGMVTFQNLANNQMNTTSQDQHVGYLSANLSAKKLQMLLLRELAEVYPNENIQIPESNDNTYLETTIFFCCLDGHRPCYSLDLEAAVRLTEAFETVQLTRSTRRRDPVGWASATSKLYQLIREIENDSKSRNSPFDYESLNDFMSSGGLLLDNEADLLPIDPNYAPVSPSRTTPNLMVEIPEGYTLYRSIRHQRELSRKTRPWRIRPGGSSLRAAQRNLGTRGSSTIAQPCQESSDIAMASSYHQGNAT